MGHRVLALVGVENSHLGALTEGEQGGLQLPEGRAGTQEGVASLCEEDFSLHT